MPMTGYFTDIAPIWRAYLKGHIGAGERERLLRGYRAALTAYRTAQVQK